MPHDKKRLRSAYESCRKATDVEPAGRPVIPADLPFDVDAVARERLKNLDCLSQYPGLCAEEEGVAEYVKFHGKIVFADGSAGLIL